MTILVILHWVKYDSRDLTMRKKNGIYKCTLEFLIPESMNNVLTEALFLHGRERQ